MPESSIFPRLGSGFLIALLCLTVLLCLASFGSISLASSLAVQTLLPIIFIAGCAVPFFFREKSPAGLLFPWFSGFVIWTAFQAAAQRLRLPFFIIVNQWDLSVNLLAMFFAGFAMVLAAEQVFKDRDRLNFFVHYWTVVSAAAGLLYIIYAATARVPVERLEPPVFGIPFLQEWIGVSMQPNNVVDLFYPGAFFALSLLLYEVRKKSDAKNLQHYYGRLLLRFCLAVVAAAALLTTKSRAGIAAFLLSLSIYFVFYAFSHQRRRLALKQFGIVIALVLGFLAVFGIQEVVEELQTVSGTVSEELALKGARSLTIGVSWQLVRAQGLLGVGLGQFQTGWLLFHSPPFQYYPERSYNDFLWMWAETGFTGIFFFFGGVIFYSWVGLRTVIQSPSYFISYLLLASIAAIWAFLFHAMVDPTLYVAPLFWMMALLLGMGSAFIRLENREAREEGQPKNEAGDRNNRGLEKIACLLLLIIAFVVSSLWIGKSTAYGITRSTENVNKLKLAARLDPVNPSYPAELSRFYAKEFEKNPTSGTFQQAVAFLDQAIDRDPYRFIFYLKRARLFFSKKDEEGIQESFDMMRERLPDFYRADLAASAFYMTLAVESQEPSRTAKYEKLSLEHYESAVALYPHFHRGTDLFAFASREAGARLRELLPKS